MLNSLRDGYRAAVFGGGGGIGSALVRRLAADPACATVWSGARDAVRSEGKVRGFAFDLEDDVSLADAAQALIADGEAPDLVLVATGLLHADALKPEKTIAALRREGLMRAFAINTIGPALIASALAPHLPRGRKSLFAVLSARVSSISDNRLGGWHGYRASKAALNMMVRNLAIEVAMRRPQAVCLALHPGTVDTGLSRPFQGGVQPGKLFTPDFAAERLLAVIDQAGPADSGRLLAWDGAVIPF
ncbi:SDR family NAD(P)-dependent oxidoreductase [Caulobacter sp. SLTY]|uniref:SDR family NAD(P)-dependent oxidoreductase n=1 Tax=Caulobacter sp. SLTY TaxID=2683262 RepID=UPI003211F0F3